MERCEMCVRYQLKMGRNIDVKCLKQSGEVGNKRSQISAFNNKMYLMIKMYISSLQWWMKTNIVVKVLVNIANFINKIYLFM